MLSEITTLSPAFRQALTNKLEPEKYKPLQILHAAGQMENRMYYLESGFARNYYYDHNGQEHTVRFWKPRTILFSYEGYYQVPSYFYTEIMEESESITLSYRQLYELDILYPEVAVIIKHLLLNYQSEEFERQKLLALSNEERYRVLRKNDNILFQKAPLRLIASYLHMSRETLTRLTSKR